MNWGDFVDAVLVDLPVDRDRINVATGNPNYLEQQLLYAVIQIQQLIPFYRGAHETIYGEADLVQDGSSSIGSIPQGQQCRPIGAYYRKTGKNCDSHPLVQTPWTSRQSLACRSVNNCECCYLIAIDPWGQQFAVFPSVDETHQISMLWEGVKTSFEDADETPFDMDVVEAVGLFVKAKISRLVDHDLAEHQSYMAEYVRRRALLFADSIERQRLQVLPEEEGRWACWNSCGPCSSVDGPVPETTEFCAFGDSGELSTIANTSAVSVLVKSLEPDFVMHMGDTNYPTGDPVTIQELLVKYYGLYIPKTFYLAFGNHDIISDGGANLEAMLTTQAALNEGKTYYDFIPASGHCHVFVLDTNKPVAEQAAWLQPLLEASDLWNIVGMHESPYTSDISHYPGNTDFRLPYKDWGAHLVLSAHGHNYERILVDNLVYVVAGLGGATKRGFNSPLVQGSQFRFNNLYGALWVTANADRLQSTFYDTKGAVVDSFALQKDAVEVA